MCNFINVSTITFDQFNVSLKRLLSPVVRLCVKTAL